MNNKKRSSAGTKTAVEKRLSVTPERPAVGAAAIRQQLSQRLLLPFSATVLPGRTRARGGAATTSAASPTPPPHRPDRLASRPTAGLKRPRHPRKRARCQRQRWTQVGGRSDSPGRGTATAASSRRPRAGKVRHRKKGKKTHSRDGEVRSRELAGTGAQSDLGISQSAISPESVFIDTAAIAGAIVSDSPNNAAEQPPILVNNGRVQTDAPAPASNTAPASQRQPAVAEASVAHCCHSTIVCSAAAAGQSVMSDSSTVQQPVGSDPASDVRPSLVSSGTQTETRAERGRLCAACQLHPPAVDERASPLTDGAAGIMGRQ